MSDAVLGIADTDTLVLPADACFSLEHAGAAPGRQFGARLTSRIFRVKDSAVEVMAPAIDHGRKGGLMVGG